MKMFLKILWMEAIIILAVILSFISALPMYLVVTYSLWYLALYLVIMPLDVFIAIHIGHLCWFVMDKIDKIKVE